MNIGLDKWGHFIQPDVDIAMVALYRHIIEMTDGIEVLVSQGCAIPALPLLRSSYETLLYQKYILEDDQEYSNRSLSWLVGYVHQRLVMYERLDSSTNRGQEFQRFVQSDIIASRLPLPPPTEPQQAIANLQSFLTQPHIQPIEAAFSNHRGTPNWFHLFNGPSGLADLALHLNMRATYDLLYRTWSRTAHGQDLLSFIDRTPDGEPAVGQIRDTERLREVSSLAASFMLGATRQTIGKFRPGETLGYWYIREVQENYKQLTSISMDSMANSFK